MVGSNRGRRYGLAAALCAAVAGCMGVGEAPLGGTDANRIKARAKRPAEPAAPELRIPADAVARGPDIPVVPVPPPPLGRSAAPATPAPAAPTAPPPPKATTPPAAAAPSQTVPAQYTQQDNSRTPADIRPLLPSQTSPAPLPASAPPHTARQLLQQAAARCATLDGYIVRLTRREFLKGQHQPEEIIRLAFRKDPFSVHFKWLGDTAKGREVVYVKGRFDNKIHTKLAAGDAPLMPAGARLSVAPDSLLARSASRHPITDAGICHCVETLTAQLDAQERGDRRAGTLTAIAPQARPEYPQPVETLERVLPPGVEPELPRGGRRLMCFDPDWQLPMVVVTYDDRGKEVEYYRYDLLQAPVPLDDDDFNPDKLWGSPTPAKKAAAR